MESNNDSTLEQAQVLEGRLRTALPLFEHRHSKCWDAWLPGVARSFLLSRKRGSSGYWKFALHELVNRWRGEAFFTIFLSLLNNMKPDPSHVHHNNQLITSGGRFRLLNCKPEHNSKALVFPIPWRL